MENLTQLTTTTLEEDKQYLNEVTQEIKTKKAAAKALPSLISKIDKLAKRNIIHANKAANLKSKVTNHVSSL